MSAHTLKIGPLPDKTPTKLTLALDPVLHTDLEQYAKVYRAAYGSEASVAALVPHMLSAFLASDAGFKRARKALP